jgi:hypothetical protein
MLGDEAARRCSSAAAMLGGSGRRERPPRISRRVGMASERFVDALNAQIAREFAASHQYVAVGAYYAGETFPRLAAFFYEQADEEREDALKMVN